jgi:hypothetical protein
MTSLTDLNQIVNHLKEALDSEEGTEERTNALMVLRLSLDK